MLLGLAAAFAACAAASHPVENPPLGPPLAAPLRLTGTFGEHRTGHLHAGIDLSTGGVTGVPVLAVESGSIVRLRAGAAGYGRALVLATDGGMEVLYGHLDRFTETLEQHLRALQHAQAEYEIDVAVEPDRFRFARGDTIAFSGATGAGPPHLHVEVRRDGRPRNPLTHGLEVSDCGDPELGPIVVRALSPHAWVDGSISALRFLPLQPSIDGWGPIGVEAFIVERSGTTQARLAPYSVRLYCDGSPIFERRFTQIDFARDAEVERVYGRLARDEGPFALRLYLWPLGAEPDQAMVGCATGLIRADLLTPGAHTLCLEVGEASGMTRETSWTLNARPPLLPIDWRAVRSRDSLWQLGLHLDQPADSARLPLQLVWRSTTQSDSGRIVWAPLADGWFAAPLAARDPLDVRTVDAHGRPILPAVRIGGRRDSIAVVARVEITEGFVTIALRATPPLPAWPRAVVRAADGSSVPLVYRGCSDRGEWLFGLESGRLSGRSQTLALDFDGSNDGLRVRFDSLLGLAGREAAGGNSGAGAARSSDFVFGENRLALFADPDVLDAPAVWQILVDSTAIAASPASIDSIGCLWRRSQPEGARLPIHGPPVWVHPAWWPLAGPVTIRLTGPDYSTTGVDRDRLGIGRADEDGDWAWLGGRPVAGGFETETSRLGLFALIEDDAPPRLTGAMPAPDSLLARSPVRLAVAISECGSGFDPRAADLWLDGAPLLAVWDVDTRILAADLESLAGPGLHRWEVRVEDRAGNRAQAEYRFTIAAPR